MKVLVACEESQEVCKAFRALGHEAYSCDIQECSGGHPEWHLQVDALELLKMKWDLIIAHPPCTYLTAAGAVRLFNADHTVKDKNRDAKGWEAAEFFRKFLIADCGKIAIENPTPLKRYGLPEYDQVIEPYQFGDPWKKRTCLWLKNLPDLKPTRIVNPSGLWVGSTSARRDQSIKQRYSLHSNRDPKRRAKTFHGIALAMAEQWGVNAMDDRTLALLGDKAAQERITERGELLTCAHCGGEADYAKKKEDWLGVGFSTVGVQVYCTKCRVGTQYSKTEDEALKEWNTRDPILTETQLALLKIAQEPRKFREGEK